MYRVKRIYEILDDIFNKRTDFNEADFMAGNTEINELLELLTNDNPFFSLPTTLGVGYVNNPDFAGGYIHNKRIIQYSLQSVKREVEDPSSICYLIDTVYHEQRHHFQNYANYWAPQEFNEGKLHDAYYEMFEGSINEQEAKELHAFAQKHDLIKTKITDKKLRELAFGAYWDNKCEQDAREDANDKTLKTFEIMLNDPNCPESLKEHLAKSLDRYPQIKQELVKEYGHKQDDYQHLERRAKKVFKRILTSGKKLNKETYDQLCNGVLQYITRHSTLSENLEIAGWAISNHYVRLIDQIDISKSIKGSSQDIHNFIIKISGKHLVDSHNFRRLATLFAPLNGGKREETMKLLVDYQVEMRNPLPLIENMLLNNETTEYITSNHIRVAVANYINYIDHTKEITNIDEFESIKYNLRLLLYNTSRLDEKDIVEIEKLYNRFDEVKKTAHVVDKKKTSKDLEL